MITLLGFSVCGCGSTSVKSTTTNATAAAASDWKQINRVELTRIKTNVAGFNNENLGVTVGPNGEIHYTTDGGKTWSLAMNNSACRFGMEIITDKIIFSCGDYGHVRKSVDGGANWTEVADFGGNVPDQCRYLSFMDENTGWIASPVKLALTLDSGKTWNEKTLPAGAGKVLAISFVSKDEGYLVDSNATLYYTKDGAKTWSNKKLSLANMDFTLHDVNNGALRFTDVNNGVIFYFDKTTTAAKCARTTDGGTTWKNEVIPEVKGDSMYASKDGKFLSVNTVIGTIITVLKYNK